LAFLELPPPRQDPLSVCRQAIVLDLGPKAVRMLTICAFPVGSGSRPATNHHAARNLFG
jgi:hypothetical protein